MHRVSLSILLTRPGKKKINHAAGTSISSYLQKEKKKKNIVKKMVTQLTANFREYIDQSKLLDFFFYTII